jgi:hypothetical protein
MFVQCAVSGNLRAKSCTTGRSGALIESAVTAVPFDLTMPARGADRGRLERFTPLDRSGSIAFHRE